MELPKISKSIKDLQNKNFGFTLIEILIVVAILSIIMGLGLFFSIDSYKGYIFLSERDNIVNVLEKARNRALINQYGVPHGVCYDDKESEYILFGGAVFDAFDERNENISGSKIVQISGFPLCGSGNEILFSELSAETSDNQINLTGGRKDFNITINKEGGINW